MIITLRIIMKGNYLDNDQVVNSAESWAHRPSQPGRAKRQPLSQQSPASHPWHKEQHKRQIL